MAILKKRNIFQAIYNHVYSYIVAISIYKIENEKFSRQRPLYTYRAAEHTAMTVNSLHIFSVPGLRTTNQTVCLPFCLNCQACKSLLYGTMLCLDVYLFPRTLWLCRISCNYCKIFGKIWHKMYALIFVQLVSKAFFLSQEEFKQDAVNELSLSCKVSVTFARF